MLLRKLGCNAMANAQRRFRPENSDGSEITALKIALGADSAEEKLSKITKLAESTRARIAAFCYRRTHLRDLGLRIAATCSYPELLRSFGTGARVVHQQAIETEAQLAKIASHTLND